MLLIDSNGLDSILNTISTHSREIDALIRMAGGTLYKFEKAEGEAHTVDVPTGAKICDVLSVGESVVSVTNNSKNVIDQDSIFPNVANVTYDGEYYSASAVNFKRYTDNNTNLVSGQENTRYTVSAYIISSARIYLGFRYTDDTTSNSNAYCTDGRILSHTSTTGKNIKSITISYNTNVNMKIKDLQVEKGITVTTYSPYYSITNAITQDELEMDVEAGGMLTFNNADGSDTPTSYAIEYAIALKEVARYE